MVVTLTGRDAGAVRTLARAFADYPMMVFLQPDDRRRARALPRMVGGIQAYTAGHGRVHTTPDRAGVACWLPPGVEVTPGRAVRTGLAAGLLAWGPAGVRRAAGLIPAMERVRRQVVTEPHWFLWLLGTDPTRAGQGIAGALLAPTLAEADRTGRPVYLDTHAERNLPFYANHGFTPVATETHAGLPFWGLRRDPR
jgi:GNAT superfamily N-acetyltransferase